MTSRYDLRDVSTLLAEEVDSKFKEHPFLSISRDANYESIMSEYLAMSQAFPFLQAGSQKDVFWDCIDRYQDVPEHVELTTVVGNFLCWDETGGLYPTMAMQLKALPRILETHRFHSNILKQDCLKLFGKTVAPNYTKKTRAYLERLYGLLASNCPITRVSGMVSFETHANRMIEALWCNLSQAFQNIPKEELSYFLLHVGGDDPAEKYHVEMTNSLIKKIVSEDNYDFFIEKFLESYAIHTQWCQDIVNAASVASSKEVAA